MKKHIGYLFALAALSLGACTENDPLADLGDAKDFMPTAYFYNPKATVDAGAPAELTVEYWSRKDDVKRLEVLRKYERTQTYKLEVELAASNKPTVTVSAAADKEDWKSVFVKEADFVADWQTHRSAYVSTIEHAVEPALAKQTVAKADQISETISAAALAQAVEKVVAKLPYAMLQGYYVTDSKLIGQADFDAWFTNNAVNVAGLAQMKAITTGEHLEGVVLKAEAGKYKVTYEFASEVKATFRAEVTNAGGYKSLTDERSTAVGALLQVK